MCGISGFLDFEKKSSPIILEEMTNTLRHRGPDAAACNLIDAPSAQIGLGHRRLSIIDLSDSATQPMQYQHLWVVYNGEVYNYKEIHQELASLGHQFITQSDTEVILHAYAAWGKNCVKKFTGMFAFVIYDSQQNEIFCARDRAGVKPFFYYHHENLFLFASELKAFHQHPRFKKEIDPNAVAAFMQFGNVPSPHCIFKHCHKLKPAHSLSLALDSKALKEEEYWNVYSAYNQTKVKLSFEEAKNETEKVLKKAFDYHMIADVPVGVFLSGGYDSACLTALLQKDTTTKIKTFTIGVPDIGLNEAPYAKEVANYLGTEHSEFHCTQKEALEIIPTLPYYYDEPFGDSSAVPTSLVCKLARKQVTVALSADGGDEVFAGYNRYDYLMKHGRFLNNLPHFMRLSASKLMNQIPADKIPVLQKRYNFHNRYEKLKSLLKDPSPQNMMLSLSKQFDNAQLSSLFKHKVQTLETAYTTLALKPEFYSPLAYMMCVDYQTYLPDDILQKVDRASMTSSLEAREPYLDHNVIEWAARLPDHYKYNKGIKKYILKEITHRYIPEKMMDRPKMGFAIPIENWLTLDLKEQVMHYMDHKTISEQGIFEPEEIKKITSAFYSGKKELALKIWYLLMFQMWYEKWMK